MDRRWHNLSFQSWPQLICLLVTCFFSVLAAVALIYLADGIPASGLSSVSLPSSPASASSGSIASVETAKPKYLMKNHDGRLAVFQAQEQSPLLVFDIYVSTLPEYDQRLLQEGIPAEGEEQLTKLIEDYIS